MQEVILQEFEGYVEAIDASTGLATVILQDVTNPSSPDEQAEIDFTTVNSNAQVVETGYIFRWRIGHTLDAEGKPGTKISEFVFATWSAEECAAAREEGAKLAAALHLLFE